MGRPSRPAHDAVLTALPTRDKRPATGRRRSRGDRLPKPRALVKSARQRWCEVPVHIRVTHGDVAVRVFCSTHPELSLAEIIATYAARWGIEVAFREMKQELGFGDSAARTREVVHRVAPLAGYLYTMLELSFVVTPDNNEQRPSAVAPLAGRWLAFEFLICFVTPLTYVNPTAGPQDK